MKSWLRHPRILIVLAALSAGCASQVHPSSSSSGGVFLAEFDGDASPGSPDVRKVRSGQDRMLAWKANLSLEVWNVSNAVAHAVALADKEGGYVESQSGNGDSDAYLKLRIPKKSFVHAVGSMEALGDVTYRCVENEDVTEQFVDTEARLKNRIVLRDRLRKLLDQATEVKDILAIETELNRVQGDIDSMEARIKALQGRVDLAVLDLQLHRKQVLGPLGYVFKGLFWTVGKLFVIRD